MQTETQGAKEIPRHDRSTGLFLYLFIPKDPSPLSGLAETNPLIRRWYGICLVKWIHCQQKAVLSFWC
jgi:hypothetical protein